VYSYAVRALTPLEDEKLAPFRSLRQLPGGLFVADGPEVLRRLIQGRAEIQSVLVASHRYSEFEKELPPGQIYRVDSEVLNQIVGFKYHQGVMSIGKIPPDCSLEQLGDRVVILAGLTNPENVGGILRSCAAFGVDSVVVDPRTPDPYLRRSVRVSMGTVAGMKICRPPQLIPALDRLQQLDYPIIGSGTELKKAQDLSQFKFPKKFALLIGKEGGGLEPDLANQCQVCLRIPTPGLIDSLNAAQAASILLFWSSLNN